ncbi:RICIN domain-containing protein [Lentzea sp. NPDC055074]
MNKRIFTTAVAFASVMAGSAVLAAPAFADDHFDVTVRNTSSGKCLAPEGGSSLDGVPIVQVTCDGNAFQRWDFIDLGDHVFRIRNAVTLKCMDVFGRNNDGTPVVQWPCSSISNEKFQAGRNLPDFVTLKSRVAGTSTHCLDVPESSGAEGLAMHIWRCNGTSAQAFGVFPV